MTEPDSAISRILWPMLASIAGAITSLSFRPFAKLSRGQIAMALFVGFSFAMFVAPWGVAMVFGTGEVDQQKVGGIYYVMATSWNVLIPLTVKKLSQFFNVKGEDQ